MAVFKFKITDYWIFIISDFDANAKNLHRVLHYTYYENGVPLTISQIDNTFEYSFEEYYDDDYDRIPAIGFGYQEESEIKNLTILFDEIFGNSEIETINVGINELTSKHYEIILTFFYNHDIVYQIWNNQ